VWSEVELELSDGERRGVKWNSSVNDGVRCGVKWNLSVSDGERY
jgi:hypothetical protein